MWGWLGTPGRRLTEHAVGNTAGLTVAGTQGHRDSPLAGRAGLPLGREVLMLTFRGRKQITWLEGEEKWKIFEQTQRLLQKRWIQLFNSRWRFCGLGSI